jgi:HAD superfamily phosphatase (TIGR01668 family)
VEVIRLLKRFIPDMKVGSIYDIDLDALRQRGIKGIITDLDNTLVGAKEPSATPELLAWLKELDRNGFRVVIVSNNRLPRVEAFAKPLGMPFIHQARKPSNRSFLAALSLLKLPREQVVMVGDQLLTDVLGGKRLGLYTILVKPIAPQDEGLPTRINRQLEKLLAKLIKQ